MSSTWAHVRQRLILLAVHEILDKQSRTAVCIHSLSPSSIRLGRRPLKPLRRVQIPLVTPCFRVRQFDRVLNYVPIAVLSGAKGVIFAPFLFAKTGLHQRRGQALLMGKFSDRFLINSPAISAAQNAHTQAVVFEVAKAIRTALDQLHFSVKSFCDAVIPRKTEHSGHFFPPIMQRLAQGAQRREGRFSKLINFI